MFPPHAVEAMHARLREVADGMGLSFDPPSHAPSTKRALALSEYARRHDKLDDWRALAMEAYWKRGRDIEDLAVLGKLATQAGLDAEAALAFLEDDEVPELLEQQRDRAHEWGVTGIPTWFMLPDGWLPEHGVPREGPRPVRVVGCQPLDVVERAAKLAGATPKT